MTTKNERAVKDPAPRQNGDRTDDQPRYRDEQWLREKYIHQSKSMREIGEEIGCDRTTVGRWLKRHGIEATDKRGVPVSGRVTDGQWLREQYEDKYRTVEDIADECGCGYHTVRRKLREHDIDIRSPGSLERRIPDERLADAEWLREQYIENNHSMADISEMCDCCEKSVSKWIHKHGIEVGTRQEPADVRLADADWLQKQYVGEERASTEIAEQCGCSHTTVIDWLNRHGIETRKRGEGGPAGADHHLWNGGQLEYGQGWNERKRRSIRERDGHSCQDPRCEVTQDEHLDAYGEKLHVHHLRKARDVDDPEQRNAPGNLITLCRDCHQRWEKMAAAGLVPEVKAR